MRTSNNIYLLMANYSIKYDIYIVKLEAIEESAGEGVTLSWRQDIAAATPLVNASCVEREGRP
jgi:hypothetical protein